MIPVARPFLGEEEAIAAREVIFSGWVTQGPKVREFEEAFAAYTGSGHACAVSSCTTALHLALLAVGVGPGDVVITVSHSFIATSNAVRHCGAEPVFVDIEPETFNMSPACLEQLISKECGLRDGKLYFRDVRRIASGESPLRHYDVNNTGRVAAVMPVHQMGMPCELGTIIPIARRFDLPIVEDAACAIGSRILMDGRWENIGVPRGDIACFSFHPRKVLTTGDGGMITTNSAGYNQKVRLLRQHGMNIADYARHGSSKVVFEEYVTTGYNYRMTDIQAAIGIEQLKRLSQMIDYRREVDGYYRKYLKGISWLGLPAEPGFASTNWQSYPVRVLKGAPVSRDGLMQRLLDNGVATRPGVMNAHEEKAYSNSAFDLKESEKARKEVVLLPIFHGLKEEDVRRVAGFISALQKE